MRNVVIPALLFLFSCSCGSSALEVSPKWNQNNVSRLEAARMEHERLKSSNFGRPNQFLLVADSVLRDISVLPHGWSYWKEKLNYREDNIPAGIITYSGSPEDDFTWGRTIKRNGVIMNQIEHFSFSETGRLLAHVTLDSLLCFYDSYHRLRQSISYSGSDHEVEAIRLIDYDPYGNLLWYAVFFQNDSGYYLNHYNAFSYMTCDSGIYVKEVHHPVNQRRGGSLTSSVTYLFFDNEKVLRRKIQTFSLGGTAVTFFHYRRFEGTYYLYKEEMQNIHLMEQPDVDITERDHLNRITLVKHHSRLSSQRDSIVYFPNDESHHYQFSTSALTEKLTKTKSDAFNNPIRKEYFECKTMSDIKPISLHEITYDVLKNGTWYASNIKYTAIDTNNALNGVEYGYREFLDHPVESFNWRYEENPKLMELIEYHIPDHCRLMK